MSLPLCSWEAFIQFCFPSFPLKAGCCVSQRSACMCVCGNCSVLCVQDRGRIHSHRAASIGPRIDLATFGPATDPHPIHTTAAPQETVHSLHNLPPTPGQTCLRPELGNKSLSPLSGIWSPATKGPLWRKHKAGRSISRGGEVRAAVKPRW